MILAFVDNSSLQALQNSLPPDLRKGSFLNSRSRVSTVTVLRIEVLALAFGFPLRLVLAPFVLVLLATTRFRAIVDGSALLNKLKAFMTSISRVSKSSVAAIKYKFTGRFQEPGIMRVTRPKELNPVEDALGTSLKCSIVMETM